MKRRGRRIVIAIVMATTMLFQSCAGENLVHDESGIEPIITVQEETTTKEHTQTEETTTKTNATEETEVTTVITQTEKETTTSTETAMMTTANTTTETTTTRTTTEESKSQTNAVTTVSTANGEQIPSETTAKSESTKTSSIVTQMSEETIKTTGETNDTAVATVSTKATTAVVGERVLKDLPSSLQWCINKYKKDYPKMKIGFGVFSLDGTKGYCYNIDQKINGACSLKAPYELWVLLECQKNKTDIWNETIKYEDRFYDGGSGSIKKSVDYYYKTHNRKTHKFNQSYSIGYLLNLLTTVSDNIAYKMLLTRYPIKNYQVYLNEIGGQQFLSGQTYGQATVRQRLNEWTEILKYINSKQQYSEMLKENLHNTQFCSLVNGMTRKHDYLHKSGWNEGRSYNSACDIAVIDNQYLIIIMTQDDTADQTRNIVVKGMGLAVESYVDQIGGAKNLFKNF